MTKAQRTITTLLAVVAVLLAVNIAVSLNRHAEAQPQVSIAPSLVHAFTTGGDSRMIRVWSDGLIEWRGYQNACNVTGFAGFWTPEWLEVVDCQ